MTVPINQIQLTLFRDEQDIYEGAAAVAFSAQKSTAFRLGMREFCYNEIAKDFLMVDDAAVFDGVD